MWGVVYGNPWLVQGGHMSERYSCVVDNDQFVSMTRVLAAMRFDPVGGYASFSSHTELTYHEFLNAMAYAIDDLGGDASMVDEFR